MKKLLLLLLLLLLPICLSTMAEEYKTHLVVWAKDQSKVAYALDDEPKITFTETELVIESKTFKVSYPLEDMDRFTYESQSSGIKDLQTEKETFQIEGESLIFPSLKANSSVALYSLNGTLILKKTIKEAGEYSFPLSNLMTGVYMVSVNGITYKVMKR